MAEWEIPGPQGAIAHEKHRNRRGPRDTVGDAAETEGPRRPVALARHHDQTRAEIGGGSQNLVGRIAVRHRDPHIRSVESRPEAFGHAIEILEGVPVKPVPALVHHHREPALNRVDGCETRDHVEQRDFGIGTAQGPDIGQRLLGELGAVERDQNPVRPAPTYAHRPGPFVSLKRPVRTHH